MKVIISADVPEWALGALTRSIIRHQGHRFDFIDIPIHPRGFGDAIAPLDTAIKDGADLWHVQYWNSAKQVIPILPVLEKIPKVLTHHNHYQLEAEDWSQYSAIICPTNYSQDILTKTYKNVIKIPYGIDLDRFEYIDDYDPEVKTVGYIGRVIAHKNLAKVVEGAKNCGYKVVGCGYIDKPDYWATVPKDNLEWHGGTGRGGMQPQTFKDEFYKKMGVFVMYSTGEKETGTLPLLEAMARGIPVMATHQGMARDLIEDGKNGIIFNEDNFEKKLKELMEDKELRQKIRREARRTIQNFSEQRMARSIAKAYYRALWGDKPVISVVIPTFNNETSLAKSIVAIDSDPYPAKEIIVVDDGSDEKTGIMVRELKKRLKTPLIYLTSGVKEEYGLARARNVGAVEAIGEILLFLDDRLMIKQGALEHVANNHDSKCWYHGAKESKGKISSKDSFVENFSWIRKHDFWLGGGFNERIEWYGAMSQDIRKRYTSMGYALVPNKDAVAEEIKATPKMKRLSDVWKAKYFLSEIYE